MIYFVVIVFLLFHTGFRGNSVLTTLYAINLGANTIQVGVIVALAAFFPMLFAVIAGRVSDRIGFRYPLIFGSLGASIAFMLPYFIREQLYILYISQTLFGLAFIFLLVNVQNLVGTISTPANRSQNYAIYSLGVSTASLIGPVVAGFSIDHLGYGPTYLILAIMASIPGLLIVFNVFRLPRHDKAEKTVNGGMADLLKPKDLRKAYVTSAIILTGVGIYEFFFPIYGNHIGFSASGIGLVLSINASAFFIVRVFMPSLINKFGEERVLTGSMIIAAIAFVAIPFFDQFTALAVVSFILGLGLGCGQPLSIVIAYNASPAGRTGEVLGIRLTVNKIVQFSIPIIFGMVGTVVGFFPVFWFNAMLFFSGGSFILYHRRKTGTHCLSHDEIINRQA